MSKEDMSSFIKLVGIAFHYYTDFDVILMKMTFTENKEYLKITFSDESQKVAEITDMDVVAVLELIVRILRSK